MRDSHQLIRRILVRRDGRFGDIKVICPCGYMDKFGAGSADPIKVANEHNDKKHSGMYLIDNVVD